MSGDGAGTTFGRQEFWDSSYADGDASFSWYAGWPDLEPFWRELVPGKDSKILIPGIGNDKAIVDMFDSGYKRLSAFDYAPQGVARALELFGASRNIDDLRVADARDLPYEDASFDAVLDKGTLDAIYISGGSSDAAARELQLVSAVDELQRVVRPGGVVLSVSAAAAKHLPMAFARRPGAWQVLRDGSVHITEDGYASINVDAELLAWVRLPGCGSAKPDRRTGYGSRAASGSLEPPGDR